MAIGLFCLYFEWKPCVVPFVANFLIHYRIIIIMLIMHRECAECFVSSLLFPSWRQRSQRRRREKNDGIHCCNLYDTHIIIICITPEFNEPFLVAVSVSLFSFNTFCHSNGVNFVASCEEQHFGPRHLNTMAQLQRDRLHRVEFPRW